MIYCNNQSCIKLCENPVFHDSSKHIDIWCHHLRYCVLRWIMLLEYILIEEQYADILTNALPRCKFEFRIDRNGVADNTFLVEREYWEMATINFSLICPWIKLVIKIEFMDNFRGECLPFGEIKGFWIFSGRIFCIIAHFYKSPQIAHLILRERV